MPPIPPYPRVGGGYADPREIDAAAAELRSALLELAERRRKEAEKLAEKYPWIHVHQAARYLELLGAEAEDFFSAKPPPTTIRVNTLVSSVDEVTRRLESKGFATQRLPYPDYGVSLLTQPMSPGATTEYLLGLYTIQGPASMLAVPALRPEEARGPILDMCAGAGVKTTQIAQHNQHIPILALDIKRRKLLALKNNASRLHVANIVAARIDARNAPSLGRFGAVLLDAPCSGEGLLADPKRRRPRSLDDIVERTKLQIQLLHAAIDAAEPGAAIVYATCSTSFEENEYVVTRILQARDDVEVEETGLPLGVSGFTRYGALRADPAVARCKRLLPHRHGTEGFTICRLVRTKA